MREIYVDSRRRIEPYGNSYTLHIQSPLKNVSKVELVSATIPNTVYNITNGLNLFSINGTLCSVSNGFYSTCSLVEAVNGSLSSDTYKISFLSSEGKFMVLGKNSFSLTVISDEFQQLTGFSGTILSNLATTSNGIFIQNNEGYEFVKSPLIANMKPWGEYVYLDIDELRRPFEIDAVPDPNASQNSTIFAIIPLDVTSSHIKTFKEHSDYKISVEYPKPIDMIDRLTIRWLNYQGKIVNFNGANDNALLLRFYEEPATHIETYQQDEIILKKPTKIRNVFIILAVSIIIILLLKRR
jgi:hypothetical protein